jgi:hypothetical protein
MGGSWRRFVVFVACIGAMLSAGCATTGGGSDGKTYRAYNKETGEYFDVKVPYNTSFGRRGVTRSDPTRSQVESAVDKASWDAESSAAISKYTHGGSSPTSSSPFGMPGSSPSSSGPSAFDQSTMRGSSYHDASSPFSR